MIINVLKILDLILETIENFIFWSFQGKKINRYVIGLDFVYGQISKVLKPFKILNISLYFDFMSRRREFDVNAFHLIKFAFTKKEKRNSISVTAKVIMLCFSPCSCFL